MSETSEYQELNQIVGNMKVERDTFDPQWREVAQFIRPRRGRFFVTDVNKGDRRYQSIINARGTIAHKTATSGMHAGIMSPARPWFELSAPDPALMEFQPVRIWFDFVTKLMNEVFRQSNLYNMAPIMLGEEILFGTGCMLQEDDFNDVARFYTQTVGSFWIAQNDRLEVDQFARQFMMTARQMEMKFGRKNLSRTALNLLDQKGKSKEQPLPIIHVITPNPEFKPSQPYGRTGRFRSVYMEEGCTDQDQKFLSYGGFKEFPVYCPRWEVTGEDIYATDCPGMLALGQVKGIQIQEKRSAQALDKSLSPPLKGPAALRNVPISSLPGGATLYDGDDSTNGLKAVYEVRPDWRGMEQRIERTERMINEMFFVDLFKPITMMEGIQPKNQLQLSQQNSEAMLQLGPVLERQHGEFLTKLIDRTFNQLVAADLLPPAPPELQGKPIKVTYISTLAMAQRSVAASAIDRLSAFIGGLMQVGLSDGLKFDGDQAADEYASIIGAPPKVLRSDDQVVQMRQERQKQEQAARTAEMAQAAANTTKMLADAKTDEPSALTSVYAGAKKAGRA